MDKNKKKFLILGGVILAIIILIIADKSFKARQQENAELAQNTSEPLIENPLDPVPEGKEDAANDKTDDEADEIDENDASESENEDANTSSQDVSYEHWLAAGTVTGISMYYMDFELEGIYLASETTLNAHDESKGVYVVFKSGGETLTIHSVPLAEERSEAGTIDLSTENFGFATFDVVEVSDADLKKCEEVRLENLSALINQLMLVTLYEH